MVVSKRVAWFLVVFGVWSWIIWPTFLKNIWADDRSWDDGATSFFLVHLVLVVVSLTLGTIIGVLGVRALRARAAATETAEDEGSVMEQILIRNLPAETEAALRARAEKGHRSVEAEACAVLTRALQDNSVAIVDPLPGDHGADIEFRPERLGLTDRPAEL